ARSPRSRPQRPPLPPPSPARPTSRRSSPPWPRPKPRSGRWPRSATRSSPPIRKSSACRSEAGSPPRRTAASRTHLLLEKEIPLVFQKSNIDEIVEPIKARVSGIDLRDAIFDALGVLVG